MNIKDFQFTNARNERNIVVGIVNPETLDVIPFEKWKKETNPQRAQFVAIIDNTSGNGLLITKCDSGKANFEDAQRIAAETAPFGVPFRCPTREECAMIYDARFDGLDAALELIDGNNVARWLWTCESDADPEYTAASAFFFSGYYGSLSYYGKYDSYSVRPVSAFRIVK